jgi:formate C-acetyltransferase
MQITEGPSLTQGPEISAGKEASHGLRLFKIQRSSFYDGPGVRTTIFFQGCNLRCVWCQNPEGISFSGAQDPECNNSIDDIMQIVLRDKNYYTSTTGGVTLSGGEPLLQDPDSLVELLKLLQEENIPVSVETTLHVPWKTVKKVAPYVDLFFVDLKVVGDDDLHLKLTNQDSKLIHQNIPKLLDLKANVKFRMEIVPGCNDSDDNIRAAAEFLKSVGYDSIELLKYHSLYEEKAERLGLEIEYLNITPEQALSSIKHAVEVFKSLGINAMNTDLDNTRQPAKFSKRVLKIQRAIRRNPLALCMEASLLKTEYYKKNGFNKPTPIHRAERLAYILGHKKVTIYPDELLVGNFTAKRNAGHVWEELYGAMPFIFFLWNINRQKPVSFQFSLKEQMKFYRTILPFWWNYSLIGRTYPTLPKLTLGMARTSENVVGFENNMAALAHFIENFERILTLGTSGIKAEIRTAMKEHPENNQDFYKGALISLEALELFAARYAYELLKLSKKETNPERRKELEELSAICRHVPKYPARTFHEALQCMVFQHVALCQEAYENAISFGRMDQILYPYYKADVEAGRITYEKAKELICLFILKMDEILFVNDGNSMLSLYKNFETLSVDQTVTFGGVDKDGNDATNDVTYMLLDACELKPRSVDPSARIHAGSPEKYLERLAEIYINGTPTPKLNSDNVYIDAILRHYPVTVEQARNYSIVGCVEPAASDSHFGNTDSANVNLALPFIQALKGQEYKLWNIPLDDQLEKLIVNLIEYIFENLLMGKGRLAKFVLRLKNKLVRRHLYKDGRFVYNPPSSFEELQERFQARLNAVTKEILTDQQKIEVILKTHYTTPLTSSMFDSCIEKGKDLYEGGARINSSGIQAVGVTDIADSFHAIEEVVYKKKLYSIMDVIHAIDANFEGPRNQRIRAALLAVPKFGDDSSPEPSQWESKVMEMWNNALDHCKHANRGGRYSAGYYALNVADRYGKKTQALPSGRLKGVPLANSILPHYGMEQADLLSSLNAISQVDFRDHAENGTTATLTIDASLFQGPDGVNKLANIFKTFLTSGGMQLQPNVIDRNILLDAYEHPEKHPYLMVRIAGYCSYFNELSDEMKLSLINRTCYS